MTVLSNGRIYTMDAGGAVADSLVSRDGRVAFVGRRLDVNPGVAEPVIDTFERALSERPETRALRPRVEHAQILAEADKDIAPLLTMLGGEVVYRRGDSDLTASDGDRR